MTYKRINLYGAPGTGKSTSASEIFAVLKGQGYKCELVQEVAKDYAYANKPIFDLDQMSIFVEQAKKEIFYLERGVDLIVTDSPLLLQSYYGRLIPYFYEMTRNYIFEIEKQFPSINVFLTFDPNKKEYQTHGRFHNYNQAKGVEKDLLDMVNKEKIDYRTFRYIDRGGIQKYIFDKIFE